MGLETEEQNVTMIDVTPSTKPFDNAGLRNTQTKENDSLHDDSPVMPQRQSDTQLKMAKMGRRF